MSIYKVKFWSDSQINIKNRKEEIVDLIDDYHFSEEEAKIIIKDEDKLLDLFIEWRADNIDEGFEVLIAEK